MYAVLRSLTFVAVMLLAASGCARQTEAERLADVSRAEPAGTVELGVPQRIDDSPSHLE